LVELSAADAPLLQRFFEPNPAYFLATNRLKQAIAARSFANCLRWRNPRWFFGSTISFYPDQAPFAGREKNHVTRQAFDHRRNQYLGFGNGGQSH
jgi:hypothetical protein